MARLPPATARAPARPASPGTPSRRRCAEPAAFAAATWMTIAAGPWRRTARPGPPPAPPDAAAAGSRLDPQVDPDRAPLAEGVPVAPLDAAVRVPEQPGPPRGHQDGGARVHELLPEPPGVALLDGLVGQEEPCRVQRVVLAGQPGAIRARAGRSEGRASRRRKGVGERRRARFAGMGGSLRRAGEARQPVSRTRTRHPWTVAGSGADGDERGGCGGPHGGGNLARTRSSSSRSGGLAMWSSKPASAARRRSSGCA